ncbi:hypothetical protein [Bartonella sp. MM73XJBT.G]|uniref:hypothetical protein n=1 Tax=Bartonella sp. MM73XJBT.G TaxID=3019097 RepID=UPI002361AB41|nr:hypothetical protein [Bartonella sp. MM73XJBT.G]
MQQDPIGLNFYNGTGGYVWQLADTMQHDLNENIHTLELQKPTPPIAINSFAVYLRKLAPLSRVQWIKDIQIIKTKPLLQKATTEIHLQRPLEQTATFFIKAGMLRLVKG